MISLVMNADKNLSGNGMGIKACSYQRHQLKRHTVKQLQLLIFKENIDLFFFLSNFWKRCGKKINGSAKLRTLTRRKGPRRREKKITTILGSLALHFPNKLICSDTYLNGFTWLGWFVRTIDSHRIGNILVHLQKSVVYSWSSLFFLCVVFIQHKHGKHKKGSLEFTGAPHLVS